MEIFSLPISIFPEGSLNQSIITCIWIGVMVVVFFNQRFGWSFSGLVVPGYLAPLIFLKPWAMSIILCQSIITYYIVYFFSEVLSRWGYWSSLFGRDRFFALVLVSIVVRLLFDGYLLPWAGEYLDDHFNIAFDYENNLHSLGLIIVALTANLFWYKGIVRGLPPLLTTLSITYIFIRYILIEYTNFNIGSLDYMYSDFALSLDASPKAYIIIVVSAFISSRMNLQYGWDFNGILIPALLTLYWYEPISILFTIVESLAILALASCVLKLPFMAQKTVEKSQKVMLFFHIAFFYRFMLGHIFIWCSVSSVQVEDFFGVGYLVSTLMAVKIHEKKILIRLIYANLQTSFTAAIVANIIGCIIAFIPWYYLSFSRIEHEKTPFYTVNTNAFDLADTDYMSMYTHAVENNYRKPTFQDGRNFQKAVQHIMTYLHNRNEEELFEANQYLLACKFNMYKTPKHIYLRDLSGRGRGFFFFALHANNDLLVEVPFPMEEKSFYPGRKIFDNISAKVLAISGTNSNFVNTIASRQTFFQLFHKVVTQENFDVLQIREQQEGSESILWIDRNIPVSLDLNLLKSLTGGYQVILKGFVETNIQRKTTTANFTELFLVREAYQKLLLENKISKKYVLTTKLEKVLDSLKDEIAPRQSNLYQPPSLEKLLFMDKNVFTPLVNLQKEAEHSVSIAKLYQDICLVNFYAELIGYEAMFAKSSHGYCIFLREKVSDFKTHQGNYIFALGKVNPYLIQIPRPEMEKQTLDFGISFFMQKKAKYLSISSCHNFANSDHRSDLLHRQNKENMFNLFYQVILRENKNNLLAMQIRGIAIQENIELPDSDIVLSSSDNNFSENRMSSLSQEIYSELQQTNFSISLAKNLDVSIYEIHSSLQARYLKHVYDKELLVIWLSPYIRKEYGDEKSENTIKQLESLGITKIKSLKILEKRSLANTSLDSSFVELLEQYLQYQDIVLLSMLVNTYIHSHQFSYSVYNGNVFLLVSQHQQSLPIIVNLSLTLFPGKKATTTEYQLKNLKQKLKSRYHIMMPEK